MGYCSDVFIILSMFKCLLLYFIAHSVCLQFSCLSAFSNCFQFHYKLIDKTARNNYLQFSDILAATVAFVVTACRNTTCLRMMMIHIITQFVLGLFTEILLCVVSANIPACGAWRYRGAADDERHDFANSASRSFRQILPD